MRRVLDRPARLVDLGRTEPQPRWRLYLQQVKSTVENVGPVHRFRLVQDGDEIAEISTAMEPDEGSLLKGTRCRRTTVQFGDDVWTVHTRILPRRGRAETRGPGKRRWAREDRVVDVSRDPHGAGEAQLIATLANPSSWRLLGSIEVTTADGESVTLTPQSVGRRFLSGPALTINKIQGGSYVFTPKTPVPLEAALLHWHIMLGDTRFPRPGGGLSVP